MLQENKSLIFAGGSCIRLREGGKVPVERNWTERENYSYAQLKKQFAEGGNIGIRLGKPSNIDGLYLHVLDVDIRKKSAVSDAEDALESLFGKKIWRFPRVISGSAKWSFHVYFLSQVPFRSKKLEHSGEKFTGSDGTAHWTWEIELFGTGKQVALPPSIHPDTGKEYRWDGEMPDPYDIPEMPLEILEEILSDDGAAHQSDESREPMGLSMSEVYAALESVIHLNQDHESWRNVGMALKHELGEKDGWAVFDWWSKQGDGKKSYDRNGNLVQWRGFSSQRDNIVTMRSVLSAARDAVRLDPDQFDDLDGEEEDPEEPLEASEEAEDANFEGGVPEVFATVKDTPAHILRPPGILGKVVDHYMETAMMHQPDFACLTALALGAAATSRNYKTTTGNMSSLYLIGMGVSGAGKEHGGRVIEAILNKAGCHELVGPKNFTSEAAIISWMVYRSPKFVSVIDEVGRFLGAMRKGGQHALETQTTLVELWGRLDGVLNPRAYSMHGMSEEQRKEVINRRVFKPALTIYGGTVPNRFFEALDDKDIQDGFLSRFIFVPSKFGRSDLRDVHVKVGDVDQDVLDWVKVHAFGGTDEGANDEDPFAGLDPREDFNPIEIPWQPSAWEFAKEKAAFCRKQQDRLEAQGLAELLNRTAEMAMRIALIVALSDGKKQIRMTHIKWAWDYVWHYHSEMVKIFSQKIGQNEEAEMAEYFYNFVKRSGEKGITNGEIFKTCRKLQQFDLRQRENIIKRCESDYGVALYKIPKNKGGRSRVAYLTPQIAKRLGLKPMRT